MLIYDNIKPNDTILNVCLHNESNVDSIKTRQKELEVNRYDELQLVEHETDKIEFTDVQRKIFKVLDNFNFKSFVSYSYDDLIGVENISSCIFKSFQSATNVNHQWDSSYKEHSQLQLYTIFGDIEGYTNEDGIILDESVFYRGPKFLESVTFHVRCSNFIEGDKYCYQGKKFKLNSTKIEIKYIAINKKIDDIIFFGIIESKYKLNIKASKNITIKSDELKKKNKSILFYYLNIIFI